ncbi:MAG: ABC transporter substrate-binding protein [Bacteroidales bacterium]|nr:ABC transporter substrate-binding protein [Bacteroidales bacterium]
MKRCLFLLCFMCSAFTAMHAQQVTFTPQWTPQSQFAGYYAALEKGFYAQEGIDVNIVHPATSYSSVNMLLDGSSDIITGELIQAMEAADKDIIFVNLLQTTQHSTLELLARKENVTSIFQMRGFRIGTWKVGFNEIPHILNKLQNLNIEWIKFINPINLYISGAIDATLVKSYNEKILFSMSGITPGSVLKFSEMGFDFPEDGLYVTEDFYKRNTELCRKFAQASRKGWEWVRNNREEALEIVMKYVKEENVPTNIYNQKVMLDKLLEAQEDVKGKAPSYKLSEEAFNRVNGTLVQYGFISKPVEYKRLMGGEL